MGINLLSYPYYDTTKTMGGITFTDLHNGSLRLRGTKDSASYFRLHVRGEGITLPAGTYTLRGTGDQNVYIFLSLYDSGGTLVQSISANTSNVTFTTNQDATIRAEVEVARGSYNNFMVYPQLEEGTELSPWTPYKPPTTINAENAKQIRRSMDVLIQVTPAQGDPIVITNENLISCVVSLRSDLSILEPTLPESEINIEAYFDTDISDTLASIPDETPVTYQAGYPGDMSPVRNFYLAEQITWQDNVMSIHAVDAVHKLDVRANPVLIGIQPDGAAAGVKPTTIAQLYGLMTYYLADKLGVLGQSDIEDGSTLETDYYQHSQSAVYEGTIRDFINAAMWLFRCTLVTTASYTRELWLTYVDAGIPKLRHTKPTAQWDIYENDCGDVQRHTGRKINSITVPLKDLYITIDTSTGAGIEGGSAEWIYGQGVFFTFDKPMTDYIMRYNGTAFAPTTQYGSDHSVSDDWWSPDVFVEDIYGNQIGQFLFTSDIPNGEIAGLVDVAGTDRQTVVFSSYVPWSTLLRNEWTRTGGSSSQDSRQVNLTGGIVAEQLSTYQLGTPGGDGEDVIFSDPIWFGNLRARIPIPDTTATRIANAFPDQAITAMKNRSTVTGSFVWKGDPRMQPRDVVTFHRLDGTTEDITLENITITHEGGGTSAEITYRKGIC